MIQTFLPVRQLHTQMGGGGWGGGNQQWLTCLQLGQEASLPGSTAVFVSSFARNGCTDNIVDMFLQKTDECFF